MTRRPVVVVGPPTDPHAAAICERVRARGCDAVAFDSSAFPEHMRITLGDAIDDIAIDGEPLLPASVYVRNLALTPISISGEVDDEMKDDWRRTMLAFRERSDVVSSLILRWEALRVPIYNPPSIRHRITKPFQLGLLAAAGLPVPESVWTNDPERVRRFAAGRRVAYKPVTGGASTKELTETDLTDERLSRLGAAPVCFQELLPGDDIRVYIIDGHVVASMKIVTDALDFRHNEQSLEPYDLDERLRGICLRAIDTLGLRFTGMDLKGDATGALKILELNPSPMFLGFDQLARTDIADRLSDALAGHVAR